MTNDFDSRYLNFGGSRGRIPTPLRSRGVPFKITWGPVQWVLCLNTNLSCEVSRRSVVANMSLLCDTDNFDEVKKEEETDDAWGTTVQLRIEAMEDILDVSFPPEEIPRKKVTFEEIVDGRGFGLSRFSRTMSSGSSEQSRRFRDRDVQLLDEVLKKLSHLLLCSLRQEERTSSGDNNRELLKVLVDELQKLSEMGKDSPGKCCGGCWGRLLYNPAFAIHSSCSSLLSLLPSALELSNATGSERARVDVLLWRADRLALTVWEGSEPWYVRKFRTSVLNSLDVLLISLASAVLQFAFAALKDFLKEKYQQ